MNRFGAKVVAFGLLSLVSVGCGWSMVAGREVEVRRTTVPGVQDSAVGAFDLTGTDALVWKSGAQMITMPYKTMAEFTYSDKLARHLGVLPAIGAGLVRKRERKHFFLFTWKDDHGTAQILEVEVPKDMPRSLLEILRSRAPQACLPTGSKNCGVEPITDN